MNLSLKIFIPLLPKYEISQRQLFLMCRPFFVNDVWQNNEVFKKEWGLKENEFILVNTIEDADFVLLPYSVNEYIKHGDISFLKEINLACSKSNIHAYAFISGDFGMKFPEFEHLIYYRMGGFRSQLSKLNQGFPAALSDHYKRIYKKDEIQVREKKSKPIVGFCGHATKSFTKRLKENLKFILENIRRGLEMPNRKDWEILFPSAYNRWEMLNLLQNAEQIETNFIYRANYRGGAKSPEELEKSTIEYYENLRNSDYVLCLRGGGNFSIRLYETLMMGRIPIFINTDCIMPFPEFIDWKKHVIWIEWNERENLVDKVIEFHRNLSPEKFIELQFANTSLWKNQLSLAGSLRYITANSKKYHTIG